MLRGYKEGVVSRLTTGLAGMAKAVKWTLSRRRSILGSAPLGSVADYRRRVRAGYAYRREKNRCVQNCIIAAGSRVTKLPFIPEDPRIIDSSGALALKEVPGKLLIIGGGIIGLEMGTVLQHAGFTPRRR